MGSDAVHRLLWERHKDTNIERLAVLEQTAIALLEDRLDEPLRKRAGTEAHQLAVSAGTFGLLQGARLAREAAYLLQNGQHLQQREVLRLSELSVSLRQELERGPLEGSAALVAENAILCLMVSGDADLAERLVFEGVAQGVETVLAMDAAEAQAEIADRRPDAVLLDLSVLGDSERATGFLEELLNGQPDLPVLVLADEYAVIGRVDVARLGGRGFLRKTSAAQTIMDTVAHVVSQQQRSGARIMIVDADAARLASVQSALRSEGMTVTALEDPLRFWEVLEERVPDLLILDVALSEASGPELSRALRNDPRWAPLPVIFLTAAADADTVTQLFAAGADDCISGPRPGPALVTRITNRLERTRALKRVADVDPLTGAASQRKVREVATQFFRLAGRHGQPVCTAMLDIDQLTQLNTVFGYAAGDRALRRVSEALLQTFRGEDIVARWESDAFLVVTYGMRRMEGVHRLAEVLEQIRHEEFGAGTGTPSAITMSAGVAQYPEDGTQLSALVRAAAEALTAARKSGGNRVLPAGWRDSDEQPSGVDVAIVEDDEPLTALLINALHTRGYRTEWFRDGQTAADALIGSGGGHARLILLDVDLPGLDGLSVLKRLAAQGVLGPSQVIMLTMRSSEAEILTALELGALDHVAKPFSLPILMQRIRHALDT